MAFLPEGLGVPAWLVFTAIYFGLGLLVGWAVKKAVISVVLIVVAVIIAVFLLGFSVTIDMGSVSGRAWSHLVNLYRNYAPALSAYPIAFVIGGIIGFWKGR